MIEVQVEDAGWRAVLPTAETLAEAAAEASLAVLPSARGDLVILLTNDSEVKDLNARFRGKDQPTNVLSFPAGDNPHGHLGDVALALGVCAAEAAAQGKPLADHLQHLVAHGVLHLAHTGPAAQHRPRRPLPHPGTDPAGVDHLGSARLSLLSR